MPRNRRAHRAWTWWAPRRAGWVGVLFAIGSSCFLIGPCPGFVELVGSAVEGIVFFVGSIFFTSPATLQLPTTENAWRGLAWWSCASFAPVRSREWWIDAVNLLGCIAFGISAIASYVITSTGDALDLARANAMTAFGALCFLVGALLLVPADSD